MMRSLFYIFAGVLLLNMIVPKKYETVIRGLTVLSVLAALSFLSVSLTLSLPDLSGIGEYVKTDNVYTVPVREAVYRLFYEACGEYPEHVEVSLRTDNDGVVIDRITIYSDCRSVNVLESLCEQLETDQIFYGDDR